MLPHPPAVDGLSHHGIRDNEYAIVPTTDILWRVHRTTSSHALAWNELRTYGPLLRFDPHPLPRGDHPGHGVWCGATDVHGALAEAFQATRTIDRVQEAPYLTGLHPARELRLLDVGGFGAGRWPTRVGGTFALDSAAHGITRRWARTIAAAHPGLDGLLYRGRFSGGPCAALFPRRPTPSPCGRPRRTRSRIPACNAVSPRPRRRSATPSPEVRRG
ncbi:hypothetical protein R1CP_20620 [Rhodococcus opacus]|uniref:RES domain-containing protein n=1 Tax=Rhodococcus opacus TaxID=37919 RepID=A0A1B1K851_RHOOP|nr:hypothetical protein R1CP_20620 [Rhodococcus opacus]